jgi:hypothetical protein
MHVHAAHAHFMLGHIMHAHDVKTQTVHAHTVHSEFYLRINGDMPAGAIVLKPVFRGFYLHADTITKLELASR